MRLFEDEMDVLGPNPENAISAPVRSQSGIGVASPQREDPFKAEYAKMSGPQEFFTRLGEFGAGVTGQSSPLQAQIEAKRKDKLLQMEELKGHVSALEHGVSMVQGLEGPEREKFVSAYATRLDGIDAGLGETYKRLADRPDLLTKYKEYLPELPEHLQVMAKADPKAFLKFVGTAEGVKAMGDGLDRRELRTATKKVQTAMMGYQQLIPKELADTIAKDGVITASEILSMQEHLPKEVRLSDAQIAAIQRNYKTFWNGLGVLHGEEEQKVLSTRAKEADKKKEVKEPATQTIAGKVYQWDPEKTNSGARLSTDPRYVELGPVKEPGKPGGVDPKLVETELKVSDDYRQDSKKFGERRPLFDSATDYMANRKTQKTSAGDAALAFAYAKMRDPNDRLAVSETRDLVKLGNIFERIGVNITGVLDKGETLPDRVATQMYDEIRRAFTEQNKQQLRLEKDTAKKVKDYGGNPERVVRRFAVPEEDLNRRAGDKLKDAPSGDFADPAAVKAAFDSGKITREQAKAALKKFGFN